MLAAGLAVLRAAIGATNVGEEVPALALLHLAGGFRLATLVCYLVLLLAPPFAVGLFLSWIVCHIHSFLK